MDSSVMYQWLSLELDQVKPALVSYITALVGLAFPLWLIAQTIYNVWFHPLANLPGPFWARSTLFWRFWHSMRGHFHRVIEKQHQEYGPVFRVSPNELSFGTASSFKTIYNSSGEAKAVKNEFYDMFGSGFSEACLARERDPRRAGGKRGLFSSAFSAKALMEQEIVLQRCINSFVSKVGCLGSEASGINMVKWYEMVSFDILGEMAFGESFNCIDKELSHFWLDLILGHMLAITVLDNLRRFPLLLILAKVLPAKWTTGLNSKQSQFSRDQVHRRLQNNTGRRDFLTNVASKVKSGEVSSEEMAAHSSTFVMAGGETTATSLAAITYYVLKSPAWHAKLKQEVRSRFRFFEEIDITSSLQLRYLQAVLKEGTRIFPASTQGLPRTSPGVSVDGIFVPIGTEFYVSSWTVTHAPEYWHEPMIFKPERWLDPDCEDNKEASQPFSLGPRACIGKHFAYAQMSLELAKLVYQYDMELVNDDLDYEASCHMHFMWFKPVLDIRFKEAAGKV